MKYIQDPPNAVQIELVEGCNLRCAVCGLNGIRGKDNDYKFMTEKSIRALTRQMRDLDWNPRIEFAMHGEPSMHPDFAGMIAAVREIAPSYHIMMTSNGGGFLRKPGPVANIKAVFKAGLNILALDDYQNAKLVPKIRDAWAGWEMECHAGNMTTGIDRFEYPAQSEGNPHVRRKGMMLTFVEDLINATHGTHSMVNNHAGTGAPKNDNQRGKRCAKPFRELAVRWNGEVAVCCNDWRGTYKCGNAVEDLNGVWHSDAMNAARVKLYHGQRDFGPCDGCDAVSYRVGLLPDKFGKVRLPKPDAKIDKAIAQALKGAPLTKPVPRPWENN